MKVPVFDVVLTNNSSVYFSGQTVQGHVIIELAKSTKIKDLRMTFHGKAFVHWTDQNMRGPGEVRFKEIRHHSATEEYFQVSKSLLSHAADSTQPDDKRILDAGQYTYPFKFHIPHTSPTSFEGQFGFIRYWTKVTIERPWKKDISTKKLFSVICPVDLNQGSSASCKFNLCPVATNSQQERETTMLSVLYIWTNRCRDESHPKGYVPGETVSINAEIENNSRRKMHSVAVDLLMTTTFHAPHKSRSVTHQVARIKHGSLASGNSDSWEGDLLVLPSLPPSYLFGCSIIDVRYTLELRVYPMGPAFELTVPLEIIIGTVPLHSTLDRLFTMHQLALGESGIRGAASEMASDYRLPHYLPPTFLPSEACQYKVHDDEDDQCFVMDKIYMPRYLTFNFQSISPKQ